MRDVSLIAISSLYSFPNTPNFCCSKLCNFLSVYTEKEKKKKEERDRFLTRLTSSPQ